MGSVGGGGHRSQDTTGEYLQREYGRGHRAARRIRGSARALHRSGTGQHTRHRGVAQLGVDTHAGGGSPRPATRRTEAARAGRSSWWTTTPRRSSCCATSRRDAGWVAARLHAPLGAAALTRHGDSRTLLILDDDLPDGRGGDLARELRADRACAGVPILVCTAAHPMRQAEIGAWAPVISKPFDLGEIEAFLLRLAARQRDPIATGGGRLGWARARPHPHQRVPARRSTAAPASTSTSSRGTCAALDRARHPHVRHPAGANEPDWRVHGLSAPPTTWPHADERLRPMLAALSRDLAMVADPVDADVVHAHTWYTHLAGLLVAPRLRHPAGAHGPLAGAAAPVEAGAARRRLRRQQLGRADGASRRPTRSSPSASGTRDDVLRLFDVARRARARHPQRDRSPTSTSPTRPTDALERHGVDPSVPYVLFVGRITRQKGIVHLVRAIRHLDPGIGVVLCAGQPDTPEIARRDGGGRGRRAGGAPERGLDRRDGQPRGGSPALLARRGVLLPIGLRAVRDHQPRGRGLRDARRGVARSAASRRWWSTARRASSCRSSCAPDDPMSPIDPDRFELNLAGAINALMADAASARGHGPRRASASRRAIQLGRDRRGDRRPVSRRSCRSPAVTGAGLRASGPARRSRTRVG